jgi:type IX secretion system substrate protein
MQSVINANRPQLKTSTACVTGIKEEMASDDFSIYPTPANEKININTGLQNTAGMHINLYNIVGMCVLNRDIQEQNNDLITLDINNIKNGIYFLQLATKQSVVTRKIIIEK